MCWCLSIIELKNARWNIEKCCSLFRIIWNRCWLNKSLAEYHWWRIWHLMWVTRNALHRIPCELHHSISCPSTVFHSKTAGPIGRAVYGVGFRPLACWDCGFESRRKHGCLSVVSIVCCQVEVSATSWSLVQKSPTDCSALLGDWISKHHRSSGPRTAVW